MAKHLNLGYFGNIWVRQNTLGPEDVMRGHQHKFDHVSLLVEGTVEVNVEGKPPKLFTAPTFIVIRKNHNHVFKAIDGRAVWYCVFALRDIDGEVIPELFDKDNDPLVLDQSSAKVPDGYWASQEQIEELEQKTTTET